jgi:hypothetical protein
MGTQRLTADSKACPCGGGRVIIHIDQEDSDWNDAKWDWSPEITCTPCEAEYSVVQFLRGAALMRKSDLTRSEELRREADAIEAAFVASIAVADVLEKLVEAFAARPTMVARHKLAKELGVESSAIGTFRKHDGRKTPRQLVEGYFNKAYPSRMSHHLAKAFKFAGGDMALVDACRAETEALNHKAAGARVPVMTFAASLGAALASKASVIERQ